MSSAPDFGDTGYLAVTNSELVLIKVERGALRSHLRGVLARVPRGEVASAELESSAVSASTVTITFANGQKWVLEAPRPSRGQARAVTHALRS